MIIKMQNPEKQKKPYMTALGALLAAGAAYIFLAYLLPVVLPFIIAWVIALSLQGAVGRLEKKAKIPKKISALFLVFLFVAILGFLCYLLVIRVYKELDIFADSAADFFTRAREDPHFAGKWIKRISDAVPFVNIEGWLTSAWENIDIRLENAAAEIIAKLTTTVLPILGGFIAFLPEALMYVFVIVFSSYYFTVDFDAINRRAVSILPSGLKKYASALKSEMKGTLGKLIKAYAFIIILTFIELFVFLSLLRVKYALIIAFITSLIDILPVLGTGTVLIPWGITLIVFGSSGKGMGVLGAYAFITIVREILEPKIVGKSMGIHPLLSLFSIYVGFKLFGILGMFALPLLAMITKNVVIKRKEQR
ncbi:MAG: sporulation integral membrane protein YtvI [Eubacteriales bacterium]